MFVTTILLSYFQIDIDFSYLMPEISFEYNAWEKLTAVMDCLLQERLKSPAERKMHQEFLHKKKELNNGK